MQNVSDASDVYMCNRLWKPLDIDLMLERSQKMVLPFSGLASASHSDGDYELHHQDQAGEPYVMN